MPINRIPSDVHEDSPSPETDKVPLFEKPLTPSDVGKLNRLVIPKHQAEKHFPQLHHHRSASTSTSAAAGDTVTLLNFEDDFGRCWRFRYSYWGSSQSYVLTKGWSRYVKENRLAAGDVVVFDRHREDSRRLFIGWRRAALGGGGGGGWTTAQYPYPAAGHQGDEPEPSSLPRQLTVVHADCSDQVQINPSVMRRNSRMLRLFGVNLECQFQVDDEPDELPCTPADAN